MYDPWSNKTLSEVLWHKGSNEKGGRSGSWQMFEDAFGSWRSMSVCFFNFVVVFSSTYFRFRLAYLIGDWHEKRQGAPNCSVCFPVLIFFQ